MAHTAKLGIAAALALGAAVLAPTIVRAQADAQGERASADITLDEMEPVELPAGRCGLFLWSRQAQPQLVFVAFSNPTEARARTNGRNRYLRRVAFGKELVYGHFERQTFADGPLTFDVEVEFDGQRELRNGAVVKQGVIRARDARQWETVTPVGGMVACMDRAPPPAR